MQTLIAILLAVAGSMFGLAVKRPALFKELVVYIRAALSLTVLVAMIYTVGYDAGLNSNLESVVDIRYAGLEMFHAIGAFIFLGIAIQICLGVAALSLKDKESNPDNNIDDKEAPKNKSNNP